MTNMYSLRKATLDDIETLVDFRIEFLKDIQEMPSGKNLENFKDNLRNFFINRMRSDEFIAWLAIIEKEVIATSGLSFLQRPPHFGNLTGYFAYIMNMYTKPEWRRKGIGSALLEKIFGEIKKKGIKSVVLHATPIGQPLYEKYGFKLNDGDKEMIMKL
ncbi:MAG: GNAT family N-acetyltransferase [Asgard group archaeon]|nr:GNAT family N-acetyltransferase [Asgard group archaeon]